MADTLNTYDVVCPGCDEEFQIQRAPAELAQGEGDLLECPACFNEWEWDYEEPTDTLELCGDEDDEGEDDFLDGEEDEGIPVDEDDDN
jgi:hypothetical protein